MIPNAIQGMKEALAKKGITAEVELRFGDLFANCVGQADLIDFNPPWLALETENEGIDQAMYYDDGLFPRFFAEASKRLKPEGKLVLLFSNLAQVAPAHQKQPDRRRALARGALSKRVSGNIEGRN